MIYKDLPFEDYVKLPGINQSSFKQLDPDLGGCPSIWKAAQEPQEDRDDDTPALSFGRAFHCYALEPDVFAATYVVEDKKLYARLMSERRDEIETAKADIATRKEAGELIKEMPPSLTKLAKQKPPESFSKQLGLWREFKAEIEEQGKVLLSPGEAGMIERMWKGALREPQIAAAQENAEYTELSVTAKLNDGTGRELECKARFDLITKQGEIHDLKTVADASPMALGRFIWGFRSHIQAAFYLDIAAAAGLDVNRFSWAFIDKRKCDRPGVYHCAEPELIKVGRVGYRNMLQVIADCRAVDFWPGHHDCPIYPGILEALMEEV